MDFLPKEIEAYAQDFTQEADIVLQELERETYLNVLMPRMLSGHLQGRVLSFISKLARPKNILEIGTYTGYASICLAEGLADGGKIYTIDINEELQSIIKKYFKKAHIEDKVELLIGNALEIIPELDTTFDLIFIDADKVNYSNYFQLTIDKLNKGGLIVADNVLWSGKVLEKDPDKIDQDTKGLQDFNALVHKDDRVENLLLPVRDGLMILRKK